MSNDQPSMWVVRSGRAGEADNLFLKGNCVAVGWVNMGDLSPIKSDREALKQKLAEVYPDKKSGAIPNNAGQLFRFASEMKNGDIIIYPSKIDRQVHIGRLEGPYQYDPGKDESYPHQRSVKWLKSFPRTKFSQGTLYEIGAAMSVFQVKTYAEEFRTALEGKTTVTSIEDDETVALVAEDIEETTRDFVIKRLAQELKGHPFAEFMAHLLGAMGYRTRVSPEGPDGGIDIIAHKDELGFEPPIIKVQVKSGEGSIGAPLVQALFGNVEQTSGEFGLFVTLGSFTSQAATFARSKSNLRLIDGTELVNLILKYYEQLDSRYKGLLPLKQVYVPEPVAEGDE